MMVTFSFLPTLLKRVAVMGVFLGGVLMAHEANAAPCPAAALRWASSSNNVYILGSDVVCTLSEIDPIVDKAPITQVSPGTWLVGANIILQNGATLQLHGTAIGGDVNELRLRSNSSGTNPTMFIRADWGSVLIDSTKVTSWDEAKNGPDTQSSSKRSFIHVRSSLGPDGSTARESRMDIKNSDVGYLGYNAAESYGLVWKVSGTSGPSLYDKVNVVGDVENSKIHHNYFGAYAYGAFGMQWINNEIFNNAQYGLDPHDDSDSLTITDNHVHDNGNHGIICSQRCDHLTINNNHVHHNVGNGIMLHRLVTLSAVENNDVHDNGDSGIALFESHQNTIRNNQLYNSKNGMRFSVGAKDNTVADNQIHDNSSYGLYFYKGSDIPLAGNGRIVGNTFINNDITGSGIYGLKMKETDNNIFTNNRFIDNGQSLLVEQSTGNRFEGSTIKDNSKQGIVLSGATKHFVINNLIENNGDVGVLVKSKSTNATITGNTIRGHDDYGIQVVSSSGAVIANNTFSDNGQNIKQ